MDFDFEGVVNETVGMRELEGEKLHIKGRAPVCYSLICILKKFCMENR